MVFYKTKTSKFQTSQPNTDGVSLYRNGTNHKEGGIPYDTQSNRVFQSGGNSSNESR